MKRWIVCMVLCFMFLSPSVIYAEEEDLDQDSFQTVETVLEEQDTDISYIEIVKQLMKADVTGAIKNISKKLYNHLFSLLAGNKKFLKQLIVVGMIAALFKNLSDSFFQGSAGDTAFYATYVIFIGLMANAFSFLNEAAQELVTVLLDYMKGMITAYSIAIVSTSGITTSTAVYEFYLMVIYGISMLTNSVILPMIRIVFVLRIINHISTEEHFSRLCTTMEWVVGILLKGAISVVLGVQLIQSMILPAIDSLKNTAVQKGISSIPGIGGGLNSIATTILGSAVVIKNSIGAAGILILLVLVVPPVLQISGVVLSYIGAGILLQPISDKRITGAVDAVIQSGKLMLRTIFTMSALFILSIAIIAFTTNMNYFAGG